MNKLFVLLCLLPLLGSCEKNNQPERELIISADGILPGGTLVSLGESGGTLDHGYSVYLHKGKIEVTDELLKSPATNSYKSSRNIFFDVVDDGEYTVIVDVYYVRDGAFGTSHYSGAAYTTVNYPNPDLSKTFSFDWSRDISTYEDGGITYVNLRPPYPTN